MDKVKISVIVPVYNSEKYLKECLNSLVNQSLSSIEIICVNDGSTDDSGKILNEYALKYSNIKVINQKNRGVIEARCNGLKVAKGEFIGWIDSDDFIDKDMYKIMYQKAIDENSDVVICNYNFYPINGTKKQKWYKPYMGKVDYRFIQQNTVLWNKIVKKEIIDKLNIAKLLKEFGESCYSLLLINAKKIVSIDKCLYNYRIGHSSLSSNFKNIEWFEEVVNHQVKKIEYIKKYNYEDKWIELFTYGYLYYCQILMVLGAYNNKKNIYLEYRKIVKDGKLNSSKYTKYIKNDLSIAKRIFFKYIANNSFYLTKLISKIVI